jgi:23S rRNA (uracil1939-C5)-methyltransferase
MDWPNELELELQGIAQGGEAVGRWEGRVVFVAGGLPTEKVRVRLTERTAAYARAEIIDVLHASSDRVEPRLTNGDHMSWQHIDYPAQLMFKQQIVVDQLAKIASLPDAPVVATLPASRPWAYRAEAQLHIDDGVVGYHEAGTRTIRPFQPDPLLLPQLNDAIQALAMVLTPDDPVRDVTLRVSETHGYIVAAFDVFDDPHALAQYWRSACPSLAGVVWANGGGLGTDTLVEELADIDFLLHPQTFFQVNRTAALVLLDLVEQHVALSGGERVLDLYCGAGTFALPLARQAREVWGVEEYAGAVADGKRTAELHGIEQVHFVTGAVERAIATLDQSFDAVVLDPPRRGCHPQALEALVRFNAPKIVYVACHPATLARDLKILVAHGYRVEQVTPVDLFPQTPHIESVALLIRS